MSTKSARDNAGLLHIFTSSVLDIQARITCQAGFTKNLSIYCLDSFNSEVVDFAPASGAETTST